MEKMARLTADTNTRMAEIIKQVQSLPVVVKAAVELWSKKHGGTLMLCTVVGPKEILEKIGADKAVTGMTNLGNPSPVQWAASLSSMPPDQFFWMIKNFMDAMVLVHGPFCGEVLWGIIRYTAHVAGLVTTMTRDMVKASIEERFTKFLEENPPKAMGQA